ncbi:hypothetical protein A3G14_04440 [Candidatus Curtissbacteria bacterium RIFCSPLOWO2_12_FULL_38_9]|uniref:DUF5615 domain-containing protein n=1 Tax=Candidatus Curtissbacteria bacterium RIFCSPLOWO2_12_FULL_38_9 TaxID=1797735 RepID=A0A1F5ID95_9BACT|nr:MAG: hypothetical protein A3G14_04440 [Candidatus Curtissbacteria bacterium RIFCSPLOWO2_12_FULL_38_9]
MTKKFRKYKLLLDEGLSPRDRFKILNSRHNLKHIKHDLGRSGISDEDVWKLAIKETRLVITYNVKDFKKLVATKQQSGVIGVSTNLPTDQMDKKITSLLSKSEKNDLFGKYVFVSSGSRR